MLEPDPIVHLHQDHDGAPVGRCAADTAHRATHSRAVSQADDTRFDQSSDSADHYGKEQYDSLIYTMLHNNFFSRWQDRNSQVVNRDIKPCTHATAFAPTPAPSHQPHAHAQHTRKYPRDSHTHHAGHLRVCVLLLACDCV